MNRPIPSQTITTQGVVGALHWPAGRGPFPGVICIGGSSGGVATTTAPLLAKAGFAALSLGYFGAPGLPPVFADLPLEYFIRAVEWFLSQPGVDGGHVGVIGTSRGSEAALQVAALCDRVSAVVAYVPSGNPLDGSGWAAALDLWRQAIAVRGLG